MLKNILEQNFVHFVWSITIILLALIAFKIYKFWKISEIDKNYEKYNDNNKLLEKGNLRNIWDYSFFPGISRLWFKDAGTYTALILLVLFFLGTLYLITRNDTVLQFLGINVGAFFGAVFKQQ